MIELARVINDLREELHAAIDAGADEQLRFELGPIELEVSVAVERSTGGVGKVRFWVVELKGDQRRNASNTQRIKLSLTPKLTGMRRPPQISGSAEPSER
jgi:hypothetical protein